MGSTICRRLTFDLTDLPKDLLHDVSKGNLQVLAAEEEEQEDEDEEVESQPPTQAAAAARRQVENEVRAGVPDRSRLDFGLRRTRGAHRPIIAIVEAKRA